MPEFAPSLRCCSSGPALGGSSGNAGMLARKLRVLSKSLQATNAMSEKVHLEGGRGGEDG